MSCIHRNHLLVGVLAAALGRHIHNRALKQLEESLLYTLATDVAGNRRIVTLAGNLVNLVNENDTALSLLHIVVGNLEQTCKNTLDILTHITGLGKHGSIHNGERYLQQAGNGTRKKSLTGTGASHHNDVTLLNLHVIGRTALHETLVMVVYRNGKSTLGVVLTNDILIEECLYLLWFGEFLHLEVILWQHSLLAQDVMRLLHAVIADEAGHSGHQQSDLILGPATETATSFILLSHLRITFYESIHGQSYHTPEPRLLSSSSRGHCRPIPCRKAACCDQR